MKKNIDIDKILSLAQQGPSKWELDNITYNDRTTNPVTLLAFLNRLKHLSVQASLTDHEAQELKILNSLAKDLNEDECIELLSNDDEVVQQNFIETLARTSALEVLTNDKVSFETMNTMCKLSPSDFILTSKRTQDLINSIHELVIQGETLSKDVAGA
jgi:hypothetical protein